MKAATSTTGLLNEIYFKPVDIRDLASVSELYQKKYPSSGHLTTPFFGEDFGCPVYVARCRDQIAGYAYITVNESGETAFKTIVDEAYSGLKLECQLITLTKASSWSDQMHTNAGKYREAHQRLVKWLNTCL